MEHHDSVKNLIIFYVVGGESDGHLDLPVLQENPWRLGWVNNVIYQTLKHNIAFFGYSIFQAYFTKL